MAKTTGDTGVRFAAGVAVMLICLSMGSLVVFAIIVLRRRMRW